MKKKITRHTLRQLAEEFDNVEIKEAISMMGGGSNNAINPLIDFPNIQPAFVAPLYRTRDMDGGTIGEAVIVAPKRPQPSPNPVPSWENSNDFFWNSLMGNHNQPYNGSEYENTNYHNSEQYHNSENPTEVEEVDTPSHENTGSYVGSGGGSKKPTTPTNPYKSIIFDRGVSSSLQTQIIDLLNKSKTLRFLLNHFINGRDILKIKVGNPDGAMEALLIDDKFSITINSSFLGDNGEFNYGFKGYDSVGFKYSGSVYQTFAAALAHEALHIKHFQIWNDAIKLYNNNHSAAYEYLSTQYSQEFANVFYTKKQGRVSVNLGKDIEKKEHALFRNYNLPLFQKVVDEYKQGKKEDIYRAYKEMFGQ